MPNSMELIFTYRSSNLPKPQVQICLLQRPHPSTTLRRQTQLAATKQHFPPTDPATIRRAPLTLFTSADTAKPPVKTNQGKCICGANGAPNLGF